MSGRVGSITTEIITDGLVFNMDPANRASYPKTGTIVTDTIGSVSGTLTNDVAFSNTNKGIFTFDGTDDYIISSLDGTSSGGILTSSDTDVVTTISLWFKIPSFPSSQKGIFQWANALADTTPFLLLQVMANGNIRFYVNGAYRFTQSVSTGVWYNTILTRTSSTNTWTLYLNGSSVGTPYDDSGSQTGRSSAASIYLSNGYNGYFNGNIGNIHIYNRALSSTEVLHNYNALKSRFE